MSHRGGFTRVRAITSLTLLLLLCAAALSSRLNARGADPSSSEQAAQPDEIRAMWVLRTSLTTPDRIATLVQAARDHGFNTLFVQVRGRGDAYYLGGSRTAAVRIYCGSLKRSIRSRRCSRRAHAAGLARARVGQRQPGVERRRFAGGARARRLPPPGVADGPA